MCCASWLHAQYCLASVRLTEHSPQQRVSERENSIRRCLGRWTRGASPVHHFSLSCHRCGNGWAQVQRVKCSSVFPHAHLSGRVLGTSVFLRGDDNEWVMARRAASFKLWCCCALGSQMWTWPLASDGTSLQRRVNQLLTRFLVKIASNVWWKWTLPKLREVNWTVILNKSYLTPKSKRNYNSLQLMKKWFGDVLSSHKNENKLIYRHPQAMQDVDELVSSSEQIWRNVALHHLLMDPLQWMGAVRMRVQTVDKDITMIYTTPVHQLTSCDSKIRVFETNPSFRGFKLQTIASS